ncbi:MAG: putative sporulation protein YtxC [Clostridia bacterium]|nr:putative sporulation protein YtxC [Clostridia bacterium]
MLQAITIGTSQNPDALISRVDNELMTLRSRGIQFKYNVNHKGEFTFLGCDLYARNLTPREFKYLLANIIADIIIEDWAQILVKKIIRDHYYYFNEEEKKSIKEKALELLKKEENKYYRLHRKEKVVERVLEYLERHDELVIEGFINFRLKDYISELEEIVDAAADDFLLEKEYLEFIRLLRYFVDIQEPKVNEVNILLEKNSMFKLLDSEGKEIENEYLEGFCVELMSNSVNYEDLLISALITLAPKQLVIHLKNEEEFKETIKTIQNVFGNKVNYCRGCTMCIPKKMQ